MAHAYQLRQQFIAVGRSEAVNGLPDLYALGIPVRRARRVGGFVSCSRRRRTLCQCGLRTLKINCWLAPIRNELGRERRKFVRKRLPSHGKAQVGGGARGPHVEVLVEELRTLSRQCVDADEEHGLKL